MKVVILPGGGGTPSTMTFIDDGPGHNCRCAMGVSKIENNLGGRRGPFAEVKDIVSADFRTKAKRPPNSCLSTDKFDRVFSWRAPSWQSSANIVVRRVINTDYRGFPSKAHGKRRA